MRINFPNIDRNIISLGFVSFFTDTASAMIAPLVPILIVHIMHQDIQVMSQVIAITTFISYAFRILFGYLGDKYQLTKIFLIVGYSISALMKPLHYFMTSWQGVASLQSSERMGKALRSASKDNLISTYSNKNESGKSFGFHKMMDIAGELFGASLIFVLLLYLGETESIIRAIFALTLIPGLIAVVIVMFYVDDVPLVKNSKDYTWQESDSDLIPALCIYFLFLLFIFSQSFYAIKATDLNYSIAILPLFFVALNLIQTLTSYHIGLAIDKMGAINMLLISFVFGLVTLVCFHSDFIWMAFVSLGLFTVSSLNAMRSYISHHAKNRSTMFGVFYAGTAISSALGALMMGYLWKNFGVDVAVKVSIAGALTATFFLFIYRVRSTKNN